MKKHFLKFFFFFSLLVSPGVYAALKWDVAAVAWVATAIAVDAMTLGTATPIMVAGAAALGFHAGIIGLYWDEPLSNPIAPTNVITVKLDPNVPLITPDGWSAPPAGTDEPVPPNSASMVGTPQAPAPSGVWATAPTLQELPQAMRAADEANGWDTSEIIYILASVNNSFVINVYTAGNAPPSYPDSVKPVSNVSCPSGYLMDTSTFNCKVSSAYLVQKPSDGRCEISKIDGYYYSGANDPDCSAVTSLTGVYTQELSLQSGTSAVVIKSTVAGGTIVETYNYDPASNKTSAVKTGFDAGNNITDQIQEYMNGQVSSGVGTAATGTSTSGGSCGGVDQPACKIDVGEVPAGAGVTPDVSTTYTASSIFNIFTSNDKLNALKGFALPAHSAVCPQPSFVWRDRTFTISAHCQLFNDHMPIFSGVMSLIWVITGTFIILRA